MFFASRLIIAFVLTAFRRHFKKRTVIAVNMGKKHGLVHGL